MGFSGLVRWINAPTTGLELIAQNIVNNHQGQYKGKWQLSMKSFRSTFGASGLSVETERTLSTLTMDDKVFCVLEDQSVPLRSDQPGLAAYAERHGRPATHFTHTFPTLSPPGALEQLLTQLRAHWVPVRQTAGSASVAGQKGPQSLATGAHLIVDGHVYAIGSDWLVRAGNVIIQPGGTVKGMLMEVEYVPLPVMEATFDMQPVLTNLLLSVLPNVPDPKIVAMTLADWQWAEVAWDTEDDLEREAEQNKAEADEDDIYVSEGDHPPFRKGDWIGLDRDRRAAYLIINVLKQEGLL